MRHNNFIMADEYDRDLRRSAMEWLSKRTSEGNESLHSQDILDFRFRGEPFRLMDAQRGIRKPRQLASALSIRTVYSPDHDRRPYADEIGTDGFIRYKWRGDDPLHSENRALRAAMDDNAPLIWFFGVGTALYRPIYPIYVIREEPAQNQFVLAPDTVANIAPAGSVIEEQLRRYIVAETKRRLHQPVFRASVLRAYETRCAVCSLAHSQLLDAAHIVPDSTQAGIAAVRNGLALCKIHHAAFDNQILGINPEGLRVEIRQDLLEEVDGPMLRHGLQDLHGSRLMVIPSVRKERPDPELLGESYERFKAG